MLFSQDRDQLRRMYVDAWEKMKNGVAMSSLEAQIAAVVAEHPEYHALLTADAVQEDYTPERGMTNPFLHMGLHLGIREQVATDRPQGIASVHRELVNRTGDQLEAEHLMIDVLAETLWDAQRSNAPPDEQTYLQRLKQL